jgi:hypothetical protein
MVDVLSHVVVINRLPIFGHPNLAYRAGCTEDAERMKLPNPELELEFFLPPTVGRPVRLRIGPPFGTLDQILACSSFFV